MFYSILPRTALKSILFLLFSADWKTSDLDLVPKDFCGTCSINTFYFCQNCDYFQGLNKPILNDLWKKPGAKDAKAHHNHENELFFPCF